MTNNKFLKWFGGLAVVIVVFLLGFVAGQGYKAPETNQPKQNNSQNVQAKTVSLMLDYGDGKVQTFQDVPISDSTTVFDVLKSVTDKNKIALGSKDYGGSLGVFIESINGVGKDPTGKKWWQYWVNNKYSQIGVSGYKLSPGDSVEFKFLPGQI